MEYATVAAGPTVLIQHNKGEKRQKKKKIKNGGTRGNIELAKDYAMSEGRNATVKLRFIYITSQTFQFSVYLFMPWSLNIMCVCVSVYYRWGLLKTRSLLALI